MTIFRDLFRFFIFSNLFIACCAILMTQQTAALLLREAPNPDLTWFVFFATCCSYSFHWWLTPVGKPVSSREAWLAKYRWVHLVLLFAGIAGASYFGWMLFDHWPWLLLAAAVTFLYSAPKIPHPLFRMLRKVAIGKTIFLAFVWMYVTTALPLLLSDQDWQWPFTLFCLGRFFLIYAICILFDYRDRDYDRSVGIRSLITWMTVSGIRRLFVASLLLFGIFTVWLSAEGIGPTSILALLLPGLLTAVLYRRAMNDFSDMLYYFVLDGLMALSALLMMIPGV